MFSVAITKRVLGFEDVVVPFAPSKPVLTASRHPIPTFTKDFLGSRVDNDSSYLKEFSLPGFATLNGIAYRSTINFVSTITIAIQ